MESPRFLIGSEQRFSEFVVKLADAKKIALVSHTDLDGIASAKVISEVIKPDKIFFVEYTGLNALFAGRLKKNKYDFIIFSDLLIKKEIVLKFEKFANLLIIDHHIAEQDLNSDKTVFLNNGDSEMCAAYTCYYLFSKIQDLSKLDWLVACASISDFCYDSIYGWMKQVANKYGEEFSGGMAEKIMKGKLWDLQWIISLALIYFKDTEKVYDKIGAGFGETGDLKKYSDEVQKDFENALKDFENKKKILNGGYFWEVNTKFDIKSILVNWISGEQKDKVYIFAAPKNNEYLLSIRRQDGKLDMSRLLKKIVEGFEGASAGGHFKAAGGYVNMKDREVLFKRLMHGIVTSEGYP